MLMTYWNARMQKKTNSINIALKFITRFEQKDFRITSDILAGREPSCEWDKDAEIEKMMNCFEDMGKFYADGALSLDHIIELHRDTLCLLMTNVDSNRIFQSYRVRDPSFYYRHLDSLFQETDRKLYQEHIVQNTASVSESNRSRCAV